MTTLELLKYNCFIDSYLNVRHDDFIIYYCKLGNYAHIYVDKSYYYLKFN